MHRQRRTLAAFLMVFAAFVLAQILPVHRVDSPDRLPAVSSGQARTPRHYQQHLVRFSSRDSIGFGVFVSGVDVNATVQDGATYHELTIEDAVPYAREGAPAVPVIRKLVAIPECEDIILDVRVTSSSVTHEVNVIPAPRYVPSPFNPGDYDREFVKDDSIYSLDEDFPGAYARIEEIGYLRDQRLAWVHVYPVQFNPVKQQITVATDLDITLRPQSPTGEVNRNVGPMTNVLHHVALNYDLWGGLSAAPGRRGGRPTATSADGSVYLCGTEDNNWHLAADSVNALGEPDYLILMANELADSLVWDLAVHRATYNGFNVSIVKMKQIDSSPNITDTPDSIRLFVKDIFNAESAAHMGDGHLAYVLLMGDAYNPNFDILIPSSYECGTGIANDLKASDAHYTFLDATPCSDPFPDLYIGRIPVDRDSFAPDTVYWELSNVVNKIIEYEPLPVSSWVDSILLVSGGMDDDFSWDGQGASGFDNFFDEIIASIVPPDQKVLKKHRMSEMPGTSDRDYSAALTDLVDTTGFRIIGLFDHGEIPGLVNTWFPLHYDTLRNDRAFPLVFSIACRTGCFDLDDSLRNALGNPCVFEEDYTGLPCQPGSPYLDAYDVFAERMLLQPNGAIGVISYSRESQTTDAELDFPNLFRSLFEDNAATLGEIVFETRLLAATDVSLRNLQLLGDPAVNVLWCDVESDSIDLAVGSSDIRVGNGVKRYAGTMNPEINVTVWNRWREDAHSVKVALLDGHPDSAWAAILDTVRLDSVPAFGSAVAALDAGNLGEGPIELFVHVDPDTEFTEPATSNNVAGATFDLLPYLSGFPLALSKHSEFPVVLADLNSSYDGEEILVQADSLLCVSAMGSRVWEQSEALHGKLAVGNVFTNFSPYIVTGGILATGTGNVRIRAGSDGATDVSFNFSAGTIGPSNATGQLNQTVCAIDVCSTDSMEVVVFMRYGATHHVKVFTLDGTEQWSVPLGSSSLHYSSLALGDIDRDGQVEIACGFGSQYGRDSVVVIDDNARKWAMPLGTAGYEVGVELIDLDDDGDLEVVANGGYAPADSSALYAFEPASGSPAWHVELSDSLPRFSVGDLDDDGEIDIVVHAGDSLLVLDGGGNRQDGRSLGGVYGPMSQPLLVDLNGDDDLEIVLLGEVIDSVTQAHTLVLQEYNSNLDSVGVWHSFWHKSGGKIGHPAIDDIDGNGVFDFVFVSADSVLHAFEIGTSAGRKDWREQFHNLMQTNVLEQPVGGTYSGPVSLYNRVRVMADATFDSTLYLDGSTIDVAVVSTDTLIEIRANDHVKMLGLSERPIQFYSDPPSSGSATWGGLIIYNPDASGTDSLAYFSISDADIAVESHSELLLRNGEIAHPYNAGIYATGDVTIRDVSVTQSEGLGVYLGNGVIADIEDCTFDYNATSGVKCDTCSYQSTISGSSMSNNDLYGVHLYHGSLNVESSQVTDNDYSGIQCIGCTSVIDTSVIDDNGAGVYCDGGSEPVVQKCTIGGSTNGVIAWNDSYPHLGGTPSDGHNCFGNNTMQISILSDPSEAVWAKYNYWGDPEVCCPTRKFVGNIVCNTCDETPHCSAPQGVAPFRPPKEDPLPEVFALGFPAPNPFNPVTTVRYAVPPPGARVRIIVYNVLGQRVAELVNQYQPAGYYTTRWDGINRSGNPVASGVYFIQMRATDFVHTVKAVVLK